jgi:hypothetical protein
VLESRVVPSNIDYSMGFANHSGLTASGSASFPVIGGNTVAQLTDGGSNQTGSILTNDTFGTGPFSTDFTFVQTGPTGPQGGELDFIVQNAGKSVGVYFALDMQGLPMSLTGVTSNGQAISRVDLSGYPINLHSQDPMHVNVTYDGSTLFWTIQDTITNVMSPHLSLSVDIASRLGNAANVGFAGQTGATAAVQYVRTWTGDFSTPPNTLSPTLTSLSTSMASEGGGSIMLTLNGSNFVSNSTAQWNGTNVATTFVSANQLIAVVPASLISEEGTAAVTVLNPGVGSSGAQTFTITDAPLTGGAVTFTATQGTPFTGMVATFSDANSNAPLSDFTATITWGDGNTSAGTVSSLGGGNFSVSGTNTYVHAGTYNVSVMIKDVGGASTTVSSTANVASAAALPDLTGLSTTTSLEGSASFMLTLNGSNFVSTSTAQWNGANLTTTFVSATQLIAVVPASLISEEGIAAVTVLNPGVGSSGAQTFTITDAPLAGGAVTFSATQGTSFTGMVATFSDANSNAPLSDFTATITWGDGNTSAGTVSSLGSGNFSVSGTNTYAQSGTFSVNVQINDVGGATTTVSSTANVSSAGTLPELTSLSTTTAPEGSGSLVLTLNGSNFVPASTAQWNGTNVATTFVSANQLIAVFPASLIAEEGTASVTVSTPGAGTSGAQTFTITDAPLTGGAVTFTATQGTSFTGMVATFSDANSNAPLSDFTTTITWGDGNTSAGTVSSLGSGNFSVSGTNTYAQSGTFTVTVLITDVGGATALVSSTANVASTTPPITATGVNISATEGVAFSGVVVATFTDADPNATPGSYTTVLITWGDGQQSNGTVAINPNGGFEVLGGHTYAEEGSYTLQVFIQNTAGATATTSSTAQVADASLTAVGRTLTLLQGKTFTGVVATFTDANTNPDINDFSATITWGDGNVSTGTITQNADGSFSVSGTNTYQTAAKFSITVVITDLGGSTATATSTADVVAGIEDLPLTAMGLDITATVSVAQDFTVAEFTDADPAGQTGNFAVPIDFGDGTPVQAGRVTQPDGPGTPFFVDANHSYNQTGTFTVHVRIFDEAGASAETFSTATVTSGASPRAPGNGGAGPLGRELLVAINGVPASAGQQLQRGTIKASATPLIASSASLQAGQPGSADLYWQFLYRWREDRITDPNGWAAHELMLALEGT